MPLVYRSHCRINNRPPGAAGEPGGSTWYGDSKVWAHGDWSMAAGTFTLTPRGTEPFAGEYRVLLARQPDGSWKIAEFRYGDLLRDSFDFSANS